jgi:hypothetical protein
MKLLDHILSNVLGTDGATLKALLADLPNRLTGALPAGSANLFALLERLEAGELQDLPATAAELGITSDELERLVALYGRLKRQLGSTRLGEFLQPLGDLCPRQAELLKFPFDHPFSVDSPATPDLSLRLGVKGSTEAAVSPCPGGTGELLGRVPPDRRPVAFTFNAEVQTDARADLQVAFLSLGANAAAAANASLTYYLLDPPATPWGVALVSDLERLATSPFDLKGLAGLLERGELHGLTLAARGDLSYGGRIGLATPLSLFSKVGTELGAGIGFTARRSGEFELAVSRDPDRAGRVRVGLQRKRGQAFEHSASLSAGMDFTALYQELRPSIAQHLSRAQAVIQDLEPYTQPSALLRERARAWLDSEVDEAALRELALAALGVDPTKPVQELIPQMLSDAVESSAAKWEADLDRATTQVAEQLIARLGLKGRPEAQRLRDLSAEVLKQWDEEVTPKLADYVAKKANFQRVAEALQELGVKVNSAARKADDRLAALRALLKRYQANLGRLYQAVQSAAEVKLAARLGSNRSAGSGQELELALSLDPAAPEAARALRQVMIGQPAPLFDALADAGLPGVELVEGAFSGFVQRSASRGLELVLMDLSLQTSSLLSTRTRYRINADGDLSIYSSVDAEGRITLPWERRTFSFAENYSFASAGRTGSLALSVVASHQEQDWSAQEARELVGSLRDQGLLSGATAEAVLGYFQDHSTHLKGAELSLRMNLGRAEVLAMLREGESDQALREATSRVAAGELARAYRDLKGSERAKRFLAALNENGVPGDWPAAILAMTPLQARNLLGPINEPADLLAFGYRDFNSRFDLGSALSELQNLHQAALALGDTLVALRQLYAIGSGLPTEGLSREQAQALIQRVDEIQERVRGSLRFWFSVWLQGPETLFRVFFDERIRPYSAAFMRSLVQLAGIQGNGRDLLSPVLVLDRAGSVDSVSFPVQGDTGSL